VYRVTVKNARMLYLVQTIVVHIRINEVISD